MTGSRTTVVAAMGSTQTLAWASSYYLPAILGALGPLGVVALALLHGAGNGVITIAKGTLSLAIFGPQGFGLRSGVLSAPARITRSAAPFLFGPLLDHAGLDSIAVSAGVMLAAFTSLFALRSRQTIAAPI